MKSYAQAFFHHDWNTWTVGYYDLSRAGGAQAYTTATDERTARRIADEYNAHGGVDPIFCHNPGERCRVAACSWNKCQKPASRDVIKTGRR